MFSFGSVAEKFLRMTFLIARFCRWQAHFAFVVKVGNVTAEESQSEGLFI